LPPEELSATFDIDDCDEPPVSFKVSAVPKQLTEYRVFIASPSGLEEERKRFRETLERFNDIYAEPVGVIFYPVGWEQTVSGVGRPQALINEDLKECDYAVFILHDRWGSPTVASSRRIYVIADG
jgi:Domain of unknown function (DUF4062)